MKEAQEVSYIENDGIMIPDIQISNDRTADEKPLGKYGQMAMNYLRDNHPNRYSLLLSEGELLPTMHRVDEEANGRFDMITEQMLKSDPLLRPENTVESFEHRKIIQLEAEEIVLYEIVFVLR